jgi:hypothetical protein
MGLGFFLDSGWIFAQHFCNRLGPAYHQLKNVLDETNPTHIEVLLDIKRRFREETFTRESIQQVILAYPDLVRLPPFFSMGRWSHVFFLTFRFGCYTSTLR